MVVFSLFTQQASRSVRAEFRHRAAVHSDLLHVLIDAFAAEGRMDGHGGAYMAEMLRLIRHHQLDHNGLTASDRVAMIERCYSPRQTAYTAGAYSILSTLAGIEEMADLYQRRYRRDDIIRAACIRPMAVAVLALRPLLHIHTGGGFGGLVPFAAFSRAFPHLTCYIENGCLGVPAG